MTSIRTRRSVGMLAALVAFTGTACSNPTAPGLKAAPTVALKAAPTVALKAAPTAATRPSTGDSVPRSNAK